MRFHLRFLAILIILPSMQAMHAQAREAHQSHAALRETIEQFLHRQASGLPGKVSVTVGAIDQRLRLPACAQPQAFLPRGSRAWGKTTVGVRCTVPSPWNIYVAATVRVQGSYIATAAPLAQGQSITQTDIAKVEGDLTMLPPGVITDESQAIGRTLSISLPLGTPLRQDALRMLQAVQQGQLVRLISGGPGFKVSAEARALNNAGDGQVAQARTQSGQVVSGIARLGGIVEVTY